MVIPKVSNVYFREIAEEDVRGNVLKYVVFS